MALDPRTVASAIPMERTVPLQDPYLVKIDQLSDKIVGMAELFAHIDPIIQVNVTTNQLLAYAAKDYLASVSERTREIAKQHFKQAKANGDLMIFVLDEVARIHRSYILPLKKDEM